MALSQAFETSPEALLYTCRMPCLRSLRRSSAGRCKYAQLKIAEPRFAAQRDLATTYNND